MVEIKLVQSGKIIVDVRIVDENNGSYIILFILGEVGQYLVIVMVNGEKLKEFLLIDVGE